MDWYKPKRNLLRIPNEFASKDRPTTELPLTEDTVNLLSKWIQERRHYEQYDGTNRLWLNRNGNPYTSKNLCYLVRRFCEEAGIDHEDRKIVWYSLRHSLGKSIEEEEDLSQASDQLRHKSIETMKLFYATSSIESRRHTLEKVNETAQRAAEDPGFNPYADGGQKRTPSSAAKVPRSSTDQQSVPVKHVDAVIENTPEGRDQFMRQFLTEPHSE
ncbi:tyrosine-type recombinase/integrase [Halegenticoccus soli]|uniref:tyrosine-type recombinase/integrase n=1 Tax=Halegenticoccus soli TaxID=1985678 RepID=UPI001E37CF7D|nr:tyrosine-type recombinase/integrase [Halegenticoccus soli]